MGKTKEQLRIEAFSDQPLSPWRKWGAYLSERSWGTVREDYSNSGDAWKFLTHDMARSTAYRWGEDGIAGWSDYYQTIAFAFAFWNGKDPILKERLFGLDPSEGNHGEDVKECYYYLDAVPSQSYMKYLYKYPQNAFPYDQLVLENQKRTTSQKEFELEDTGVFANGCYFDIFIEYAKNTPEDIVIKCTIYNRAKEKAYLEVLPHLWFRNRWSWEGHLEQRPSISLEEDGDRFILVAKTESSPRPLRGEGDYTCPTMYLYGNRSSEALFTHNETKGTGEYTKEAFHRYVIAQEKGAVSPEKKGTKSAYRYQMFLEGEEKKELFFRLSSQKMENPLEDIEDLIAIRVAEADAFYATVHKPSLKDEEKKIQRAALAGMIWGQQLYIYDVKRWLKGDLLATSSLDRSNGRNSKWSHLYACDVISMPDKWEYPWFASWDLCFHTVTLALVDLSLAKDQLLLLLRHWFQHVNGQIPAYEWNFSDVNPPVQAWALWKLYMQGIKQHGEADDEFLLFGFLKLVENFGWWVNKVDRLGNNFFEGGFLGLDNISVVDRSSDLSDGAMIEQSDATGWMGLYALLMMKMALILAKKEPIYQSLATTFFENFIYISNSIHELHGMWDEEEGFFFDVLMDKEGKIHPMKIKSFVGIIPFFSLTCIEEEDLKAHPGFYDKLLQFQKHNQEKVDRCVHKLGNRFIFSLMPIEQLEKVLIKAFDEKEFLSDFGIRSISKDHEQHPLNFNGKIIQYEPGESLEKIKGGNSNWRGPIWFPTNFIFLDAIRKLIECIGPEHKIHFPSSEEKSLGELHQMLRERLVAIFRKTEKGRPVHGESLLYKEDPNWKDLLLFYEHYHGDTGRGLGASHQTGWGGLIACIIDQL